VARGGTRLGRALTVGLADAGYDLAVLASGTTAEDARLEDRVVRSGRRIRLLDAGLDGPDHILQEVQRGFGRLDAVITFPAAPADDGGSDPAELLAEPFHLVRRCATALRESRGAVVVCLGDASDAATAPLQALTRALGRVMAPHVRVNAVAPGPGEATRETDWIRAVLFVLASPHLGGEIVRVGDGDAAP
jgi:NAD(P)-dependent dehydrogenase (short-subunit alcohol dehydrogenase family)